MVLHSGNDRLPAGDERGRLSQPDEAAFPLGRSAILTCAEGGG